MVWSKRSKEVDEFQTPAAPDNKLMEGEPPSNSNSLPVNRVYENNPQQDRSALGPYQGLTPLPKRCASRLPWRA